MNLPLYEAVEQLAPFGRGNPVPVFASKKMSVVGGPWVLKDQHLKLQVSSATVLGWTPSGGKLCSRR